MTLAKPLVSIMMPCYNSAVTLPMALASLLAQSYEKWECLVVDDGSTDDSGRVAEQFDDPRIKYHRFEKNMGRGVARQYALDQAKGQYLTFLDADDWLYPNKLERQLSAFSTYPGSAIVSTALAVLSPSGELLGTTLFNQRGVSRSDLLTGEIRRLQRPPFPLVSLMIRMELTETARYKAHLKRAQDLDFFLQVAVNEDYIYLNEPLYVYSGWAQPNKRKMIETLGYEREIFWSYREIDRASALLGSGKAMIKQMVYRCAYALGLERHIHNRLAMGKQQNDQAGFVDALRRVASETTRALS